LLDQENGHWELSDAEEVKALLDAGSLQRGAPVPLAPVFDDNCLPLAEAS